MIKMIESIKPVGESSTTQNDETHLMASFPRSTAGIGSTSSDEYPSWDDNCLFGA